jgi:GGDEF domain-containing protein
MIQRIKNDILKKCYHQEIDKQISVSIGIALSSDDKDIFNLIQEADENMYQMKRLESKAYTTKIVEFARKSDRYIR